MIGDVEDRNPRTAVIFLALIFNCHSLHDQHVERKQVWKPSGAVSFTDKILLLVQCRVEPPS